MSSVTIENYLLSVNSYFSCQTQSMADLGKVLSKASRAGQTEGEGLKISDLVFTFLNVPTGCGHDL